MQVNQVVRTVAEGPAARSNSSSSAVGRFGALQAGRFWLRWPVKVKGLLASPSRLLLATCSSDRHGIGGGAKPGNGGA